MTEPQDWLQRTIDTPKVTQRLIERFGADKINAVTKGDRYDEADAAQALALAQALLKSKLTQRKQKRIGPDMLDWMRNTTAIIFMLGYEQAKDEQQSNESV